MMDASTSPPRRVALGRLGRLRSQERLERLERLTRVPMLALALVMIPVLVVPEVLPLTPAQAALFDWLDLTIWGLFAVEFAAKVAVAPNRGRYLRAHWLDALVVLLPFLRPLRVARAGRALLAIRLARVVAAWADSLVMLRRAFRRHGMGYLVLSLAVVVAVGAVLITAVEHDAPNATVHGIWDGLWWATATVSTVGYGDIYPVTAAGKALAVVLMVVGIGFFSAITAIIAATILETGQGSQDDKLDEALRRLTQLEELLRARSSADGLGARDSGANG